jgi:hypothetical protein
MSSIAMWTIYRSPADHPGQYVVRRFMIPKAGGEPVPDPEPCFIGRSLAAAREAIPLQADACLQRSPDDERSIIETWL